MHNQFARSSAHWPISAMSFAVAISAALSGSVYSQPPALKYDADTLADRQAAIAAVLKAGGEFIADAEVSIEPAAEQDVVWLRLIEASKTDILLPKLSSLSELQVVELTASDVTDAGLKYLAAIRNLKSLTLARTRVNGAGFEHLAALGKLHSLDLAQTSVDDSGLKHLARLEQLESLDLERTAIDDAGLERLKPLTRLRHLGLRGTRITAAGLKALQALPQLVSIDVSGTAVTPADVLLILPQITPQTSTIVAALNEKTELDFKKQPLSGVIEYLKERHEIEIELDIKSLAASGIDTETPITCKLQDITLREALATILDRLELTFVVRHDVLLIAAQPIAQALNLPEVAPGERLSPVLAKALLRPSPLAFVEQPLSEVVEYLKVTHGIDIEIDQESLVDEGFGVDMPVTRNVKNVSLRSALELLLGELGLTCVAKGDKLIVRARGQR